MTYLSQIVAAVDGHDPVSHLICCGMQGERQLGSSCGCEVTTRHVMGVRTDTCDASGTAADNHTAQHFYVCTERHPNNPCD